MLAAFVLGFPLFCGVRKKKCHKIREMVTPRNLSWSANLNQRWIYSDTMTAAVFSEEATCGKQNSFACFLIFKPPPPPPVLICLHIAFKTFACAHLLRAVYLHDMKASESLSCLTIWYCCPKLFHLQRQIRLKRFSFKQRRDGEALSRVTTLRRLIPNVGLTPVHRFRGSRAPQVVYDFYSRGLWGLWGGAALGKESGGISRKPRQSCADGNAERGAGGVYLRSLLGQMWAFLKVRWKKTPKQRKKKKQALCIVVTCTEKWAGCVLKKT